MTDFVQVCCLSSASPIVNWYCQYRLVGRHFQIQQHLHPIHSSAQRYDSQLSQHLSFPCRCNASTSRNEKATLLSVTKEKLMVNLSFPLA